MAKYLFTVLLSIFSMRTMATSSIAVVHIHSGWNKIVFPDSVTIRHIFFYNFVKVTNNFHVDKSSGHLALSLAFDIVDYLLLVTLYSLGLQNTTFWVFLLLTGGSFSILPKFLTLKWPGSFLFFSCPHFPINIIGSHVFSYYLFANDCQTLSEFQTWLTTYLI